MMRLATAEIMRQMDRKAIEEYGLPGMVLMENAARGTVQAMKRQFPDIFQKRIGIFAGRGNNGGDAFAVARYLLNHKVDCRVYLIGSIQEVKGDARANLEILKRLPAEVREIRNEKELQSVKEEIASCHLFVDGIFGTGLNAPVQGLFHEVIDLINYMGRPVVAIDIPSGLHADSGQALGTCIQASLTVTFGLAKRGLLVQPGVKYCGKLIIVDISLPSRLMETPEIRDYLTEGADFRPLLVPRDPEAHKGDFGHLLAISGSPGKTGAAAMVCQAAIRVGTGLVTLAVPKSLHPVMASKLTEVMTELLPESEEHTLGLPALEKIRQALLRKTAVAMGPGLSLHPETQALIPKIVAQTDLPMVIDADGLTALAGHLEVLRQKGERIILTPHPGEMARLAEMNVPEIQRNRIEVAREFAIKHRTILVLKGASSIVASPKGEVFINPTGNPGMASGGMGDVLTGMIGGFLAQGYLPLHAAQLGVYLHGLAGDFSAFQKGERGIIASDLIAVTPRILQAMKTGAREVDGFSFAWRQEAQL